MKEFLHAGVWQNLLKYKNVPKPHKKTLFLEGIIVENKRSFWKASETGNVFLSFKN